MRSGKISAVDVELRDFSIRALAVEKTEEGYLADWESWVGYSELSWEEMQEKRPQEPKLFRVLCLVGKLLQFWIFRQRVASLSIEVSQWRARSLRVCSTLFDSESMMSSVKGARGKGGSLYVEDSLPGKRTEWESGFDIGSSGARVDCP